MTYTEIVDYNPDTDKIIFVFGNEKVMPPDDFLCDFYEKFKNFKDINFMVMPDVFKIIVLRNDKKKIQDLRHQMPQKGNKNR